MTALLHDIEDARAILGGMSRTVLYEEIQAGRITPVKIGRKPYIAHSELERYVASLAGASAQ